MLRFILAPLLTASIMPVLASGPLPPQLDLADDEPDPKLARPLDHRPTASDLARLRSVKGKSKSEILKALGHPARVQRLRNGIEFWDYPWVASCRIWLCDGVCFDTFYTAGY